MQVTTIGLDMRRLWRRSATLLLWHRKFDRYDRVELNDLILEVSTAASVPSARANFRAY